MYDVLQVRGGPGSPAPQRARPVGRLEGSPPAVCREKCAFLLGFQNFPNTSDLIPAGFLGSTLKQQEVFKITGFSFE
ncbi:Serine/Threonine-Protein Kinase 32C [Manis pentadactyla]|nr:Serine/Threonine-Protein Kinase 32C [Manis pentadactyla]